jgi:hypothetical protein
MAKAKSSDHWCCCGQSIMHPMLRMSRCIAGQELRIMVLELCVTYATALCHIMTHNRWNPGIMHCHLHT